MPVFDKPFSHFTIEKVLSDKDYNKLLSLIPESLDSYKQSTYSDYRYQQALPKKMWNIIEEKVLYHLSTCMRAFNIDTTETQFFHLEPYLLRDLQGFDFYPHTDTIDRLLIFMYYLPKDDSMKEYGTSIFEPKDKNFTYEDKIGKQHPIEDFNLIKTVPYIPNSMMGFKITNNSFHGVMPINKDIIRDTIIILLKDTRKVEERFKNE